MKFIHLTDTHIVAGAGDLYGTNPKTRLQQAVAHICAHQADADALVLTGDLTHIGDGDAYQQVCECLAPLPMPVYPILGNHDCRSVFKEHFKQVPSDAHGFIQYTRDFGDYRAIFLDTNKPGAHWGEFCELRAQWLRTQLAATDRPVLLFMHHPFFPVGIGSMDTISLRDTAPFLSAIAGYQYQIKHIFFGHIHRPIFGSINGMPFSTLRGTNHQVALTLDEDAAADIIASHEPPQYAVVLLDEPRIVIHLEDFSDHNRRFALK